jgi:hypothetical protein
MIERFQTYRITYQDTTGTGSSFSKEITLDPDAPFRLTGIAIWVLGAGGISNTLAQTIPAGIQIRYTRPDRMWVQRNMLPGNALTPGFDINNNGQAGSDYMLWSPVSPNMVYPPSGTVQFDIQTQPFVGPLDLLVVLIGTKIFRDGAVWAPTYPAKWNALPFFGYGVQANAAALPVRNQPLAIAPDADFVWQCSTHSDTGGAFASLDLGGEALASILFTAALAGTGGNAITIDLVQAGLNTPLSITVIADAITVNLATDGLGKVRSTGQDVINIINATPAATALITVTGQGGLADLSPVTPGPENLTGGTDATPNKLLDLGVKITDFALKPYMNDYIPLGLLFGFGAPQIPGLPYPEIYIPKNQALYFDFAWIPSQLTPAPPVANIATVTLKGMKVYS